MTDTEMELLFRNMIEFLPHDRHNKVWSAIGVGPNEELWYFIALSK